MQITFIKSASSKLPDKAYIPKSLAKPPATNLLGKAAQEAGGGITARNLTSQAERLMSAPLVAAGGAASALGYWNARQRDSQHRNQKTLTLKPKDNAQAPIMSNALANTPKAAPGSMSDALMQSAR